MHDFMSFASISVCIFGILLTLAMVLAEAGFIDKSRLPIIGIVLHVIMIAVFITGMWVFIYIPSIENTGV